MLSKIRRILAILFFLALTALFLDFSGVLHHYLGWIAKIQFFPAVMATDFIVVIAILLVTLLFGRVYCSFVCPLGVLQDGFSWMAGKVKKNRFAFVKAKQWLRWSLFAVFVLLVLVGMNGLASLVAPYSAYGRIATNLFQPVYLWINNILASIAERHDSYAFYHVDVWVKSGVSLAVAAVTLAVIVILAIRRGRTWCNTVCPVGTLLGLVSEVSLFRPVIDEDKCKNCHNCEKKCKASCIDIENHRIDYSRCVACMDCLDSCKFDALTYCNSRFRLNPASDNAIGSASRRKFLVTGAMVAGAAVLSAQEKKIDGGLAAVQNKMVPHRDVPIKPAGSLSLKNFTNRCTGCQLCVSECPNQVLRPSQKLDSLLQPEMSFERGFCRPECTRCGEVCPTGAIHAVTREEKSDIHIGFAVVVRQNCLAWSRNVNCGNCARHCPTQAIVMVPVNPGESQLAPAVNTDKCIGCGACEYLCPTRPLSAIYVNGREKHC